jgi:hypothetical protein
MTGSTTSYWKLTFDLNLVPSNEESLAYIPSSLQLLCIHKFRSNVIWGIQRKKKREKTCDLWNFTLDNTASLPKWRIQVQNYTKPVNKLPILRVKFDNTSGVWFLAMGLDWVHFVRRPLIGLSYQPRVIDDDDERGTVYGMRIGRGNQSVRRKPAPVPLCPPQILHGLTWDRTRAAKVGSRRLTTWAVARPVAYVRKP